MPTESLSGIARTIGILSMVGGSAVWAYESAEIINTVGDTMHRLNQDMESTRNNPQISREFVVPVRDMEITRDKLKKHVLIWSIGVTASVGGAAITVASTLGSRPERRVSQTQPLTSAIR